MTLNGKIDSVYDFTDKGLRELESWLEPWLKGTTKGEVGIGGDLETEDVGTSTPPVDSGIFFDVSPQPGGFLRVDASSYVDVRSGDNISLWDRGGGGIYLTSDAGAAGGGYIGIACEGELFLTGDQVVSRPKPGGNMDFQEHGGGLLVRITDAGQVLMFSLPTTDPGEPNALWNDGGTVVFSGSTAGGGGGGGIQFDVRPQEGGFLDATATSGEIKLESRGDGSTPGYVEIIGGKHNNDPSLAQAGGVDIEAYFNPAHSRSGQFNVYADNEIGLYTSLIGLAGETGDIGFYSARDTAVYAKRDAYLNSGLDNYNGGDVFLYARGPAGSNPTPYTRGDIVINADGDVRVSLPTVDPGVLNALWNDRGTVVFSGSRAGVGLTIPFSIFGALSLVTGALPWDMLDAGTITKIQASVGAAPTGSGLTVAVKKNGASVATLTLGAGVSKTTTTPSIAVAVGDRLTVDVTAIGSTTPGSNLVVQIQVS